MEITRKPSKDINKTKRNHHSQTLECHSSQKAFTTDLLSLALPYRELFAANLCALFPEQTRSQLAGEHPPVGVCWFWLKKACFFFLWVFYDIFLWFSMGFLFLKKTCFFVPMVFFMVCFQISFDVFVCFQTHDFRHFLCV